MDKTQHTEVNSHPTPHTPCRSPTDASPRTSDEGTMARLCHGDSNPSDKKTFAEMITFDPGPWASQACFLYRKRRSGPEVRG